MRHQKNDQVEGIHREKQKQKHTKCTQQMKGIEYETACSGEGTIRLKEKKRRNGKKKQKRLALRNIH